MYIIQTSTRVCTKKFYLYNLHVHIYRMKITLEIKICLLKSIDSFVLFK